MKVAPTVTTKMPTIRQSRNTGLPPPNELLFLFLANDSVEVYGRFDLVRALHAELKSLSVMRRVTLPLIDGPVMNK